MTYHGRTFTDHTIAVLAKVIIFKVHQLMTFEEARTKDAFEGFIMANYFLRTYPSSNSVQASHFNGGDKDRIGRLKWLYIQKIAGLKSLKIVWPICFR